LAYYESPPGIQLLHAIRFDDSIEGGYSTFLNGHAVAEELRRRDPIAFNVLKRVPATFQKDHMDRDYPAQMFYQRPHIVTNSEDEVTAIFWSPPFEGPLRVDPADVEPYYAAYRKFRYMIDEDEEIQSKYSKKFRLKPGQMVVFNNRSILHGREPFSAEKGVRHLQGAYVNIDECLNRYKALRRKHDTSADGPRLTWGYRVGNQSMT
jgi:alpha-ketoglutarate-dependent taurine dioxygenase